jgi:hypothetical protein
MVLSAFFFWLLNALAQLKTYGYEADFGAYAAKANFVRTLPVRRALDFALAANGRNGGPHRSIIDHLRTAALGRGLSFTTGSISGLTVLTENGLRRTGCFGHKAPTHI